MVNIPKLSDLNIAGKKVIVRADLDVVGDSDYRLNAIIPTLDYLKEEAAEIIVIGHRGRPQGKFDQNLSTMPLQRFFDKWGAKVEENLRFDPGEEANNPEYADKLAGLGDVYVNEAFASSHREMASITGLPKLLPHAAGLRFIGEVENLSKVLENPKKPVLFVIGGSKKDKLDYIENLKSVADKILVGGRLPEYLGDVALESIRLQERSGKILIGNLIQDKEDLTLNSIEVFEEEIARAGTIVLAGPMGKYEEAGHSQATERVFKAVAASSAFKVTGGGDSLVVIDKYNLTKKFDWVSVGGGAMLEFLAKKTLPGIEALLH